jgi:prepilin-type N-terminal cleavage/methylation domain-containing protein
MAPARSISLRSCAGYTLVECLVVVAILALLSTILASVLGRARWHARDSAEEANLSRITEHIDVMMDRQIGTGGMIRTYNDGRYRVDQRSLLQFAGVSAPQWTDPYRREPISEHPRLGGSAPGAVELMDEDFPEEGRGRIYLDFVTRDSRGYTLTGGSTNPAGFVNRMLPDQQFLGRGLIYAIFSAGPDGTVDMDLGKDIVFVKGGGENSYHGGFGRAERMRAY